MNTFVGKDVGRSVFFVPDAFLLVLRRHGSCTVSAAWCGSRLAADFDALASNLDACIVARAPPTTGARTNRAPRCIKGLAMLARCTTRSLHRPSSLVTHVTCGKLNHRSFRLATMEDPAEIAVLTSEYISSMSYGFAINAALDNLPHEVTHILREIELKDAKVQGA